MLIKKSAGKIFGAHLTRAEEKAMNMEIQRQLAAYNEKNADEIDAIILWFLHEEFGFGEKRLRRAHDRFIAGIRALNKRYEITDDEEQLWICTRMLLEDGIDIRRWNQEGVSLEDGNYVESS